MINLNDLEEKHNDGDYTPEKKPMSEVFRFGVVCCCFCQRLDNLGQRDLKEGVEIVCGDCADKHDEYGEEI